MITTIIVAIVTFFLGVLLTLAIRVSDKQTAKDTIAVVASVLQSAAVVIAVIGLAVQYWSARKDLDLKTYEFVDGLDSKDVQLAVDSYEKLVSLAIAMSQHGEVESCEGLPFADVFRDVKTNHGRATDRYLSLIHTCLSKGICDEETTKILICRRVQIIGEMEKLASKCGLTFNASHRVFDCANEGCTPKDLASLERLCAEFDFQILLGGGP